MIIKALTLHTASDGKRGKRTGRGTSVILLLKTTIRLDHICETSSQNHDQVRRLRKLRETKQVAEIIGFSMLGKGKLEEAQLITTVYLTS